MSVYLTIPSARPAAQANPILEKWRAQGYHIALWLDPDEQPGAKLCDLFETGQKYPGYAVAVNQLIKRVRERDPGAEWFVCAGDDTLPDPNKDADQIGRECAEHFAGTMGVMQPTGDRWGIPRRAYIDHVAGSPFIGREFARRMYGGNGPYWPEYTHMGVDEELQKVAIKYGVFWQRRDLTHHHEHWARARGLASDMPAFLAEANSKDHWDEFKALMAAREAAGFPGSEPLG